MDQILVHVSAPSSFSDDARYRAQVAAIRSMLQSTAEAEGQPAAAIPSLRADQSQSDTRAISAEVPTQIPIQTQIGRDSVPISNAHSLDSLDSIISVIPDSQPQALAPALQNKPPEPLDLDLQDDLLEPPSKRRRFEVLHCTSGNPGPVPTPVPIPIPTRLSPTPLPRPISTDSLPYTSIDPSITSLPVEIRPPPPPISTDPFTTHITPTLDMLVDRLNPARIYKPVRQVRALDVLERGYWAVQITIRSDPPADTGTGTGAIGARGTRTHWNKELFARFWGFLSVFIGREGRAGWGVWCFLERDEDHGLEFRSGLEEDVVRLKVYAWGEIAMHIYLLLFLASERRIKGMGARWYDSREEVVIEML